MYTNYYYYTYLAFLGVHERFVGGWFQSGGKAEDHLVVFPHQRPHWVCSTLRSRTRGEWVCYINFGNVRPDYHYQFLEIYCPMIFTLSFCTQEESGIMGNITCRGILPATQKLLLVCRPSLSVVIIGMSPVNYIYLVNYRKQECWRIQVTMNPPRLQWHQQPHQVSSSLLLTCLHLQYMISDF